jgi:hypothetical protein
MKLYKLSVLPKKKKKKRIENNVTKYVLNLIQSLSFLCLFVFCYKRKKIKNHQDIPGVNVVYSS